ncbi:MAG: class I SAM-dependent methyltransferase [Pirellulales bacterium]|nr:class I SAM-dependent methyltransferase [Pirellulales bacterium]
MTKRANTIDRDWQLQHYASAGRDYGNKHFTQADSEFTAWILDQIAAVNPAAKSIAEIGAGTCIFASLLGKKLGAVEAVTCYEPVAALLEGAAEHDNIEATCGSAVDFARDAPDDHFELIFTKDTAHHFASDTLDEIHGGICDKLVSGGRYAMVVRTPPQYDVVPVGQIAATKWPSLYTSLDDLLQAMRRESCWKEIDVLRWEKYVSTPAGEWLDGIRSRDTWSVFSAMTTDETEATITELKELFDGEEWFEFLHQYDVAIFEKI